MGFRVPQTPNPEHHKPLLALLHGVQDTVKQASKLLPTTNRRPKPKEPLQDYGFSLGVQGFRALGV